MTFSASDIHYDMDFAQIAFQNYLKMQAACFYNEDTNQPYNHQTAALKYKPLTADEIGFLTNDQVRETETEWLRSKGLTEIAKLKRGTSSYVLAARTAEGRQAIVRIPITKNREEHSRIDHPAVLQPFAGCTLPHRGGNIEILPFVKVLGLTSAGTDMSETSIQRSAILRQMYRSVGLEIAIWGVKNDLSVLPDGTPVVADPDILSFKSRPMSLSENTVRMAEILKQFPYMASAAWIKDGKPAQEKFFGGDYLTGPAPVATVSLLHDHPRGGEKSVLGSPRR